MDASKFHQDYFNRYGCCSHLPDGAQHFASLELTSNHLGTAGEGTVVATASLVHAGRTTQVWDATVTNKITGKTIALFRCTQMILYPK
jgi:1,4-dihydroxy-2-naphthoyl-CoA hydrolase